MIDKSLTQRFEENAELDKAVQFILETLPEKFSEAAKVRFAAFFTKRESPVHFAGQCRKLSDAVRFKTGLDFILLIYKDNFLKAAKDEQLKILIHELHHIRVDDKGKPKIRRHNEKEDFCELPSHDKYSEQVLAQLVQEYIVKQKKKAPASAS
ncbi:MAG: putative metallopeptidase [Rhabdochlamydiaceae bacterium]